MTLDLTEVSLRIRKMEDRDLPRVVEIDQRSFTLPWSLISYQFEIKRSRISRCWVAEVEEGDKLVVAGMVVAWLIVDEMHIGTIAVDEPYRNMGVASALMDAVHQQALEEHSIKIFLEVRKSNIPAQNLYHKYGYQVVGVRKGYYADNHEDAFLMEYQVQGRQA
jgi:ribosomal-protein-alanine N-acetyltransferase